MAGPLCTLVLVLVVLVSMATGGMDSCYDAQGRAQRCMPMFENAAFGREVQVTNTCGSPPEDYCLQMGTWDASSLCHRCDAADDVLSHNATYLTDFHSQGEATWWQSQSMAFGVQHPNSVNLTLHLGKSYEITYIRLKFHTSRPESFAIYKRSQASGPWIPYQYYSASCGKTYRKLERHYLCPGEDEHVAFCTDEFSDISPLSGGNVAFSTLEGRPSAYSFDQSPILQEWVTGTDLLISLNRLNTFGDDIFKDPKVLQSYYYAISDFSVGGRCKCNGHASQCLPNEEDQLVCLCEHNTTGVDCDACRPFYQDRPWARGTAESANECLPCNCSGWSDECFYDWQLYRRTGHGGHCQNCQGNTDGPHCEHCRPNFYRWDVQKACQPCNCNPAGSLSLQCDSSGTCNCKPTVTGWKCERCQDGFHSLSEGGCRPCTCDAAGSVGTCDANTGHCTCKAKVEGYRCNRCQPGTFNLQPHNPAGCTSCFCYGHSSACTAASGYEVHQIVSDFSEGADGWRAEIPSGAELPLRWVDGEIFLEQNEPQGVDFGAPEKFLCDRRLCYGQILSVVYRVEDGTSAAPSFPVWLILEGDGLFVSTSHISSKSIQNGTSCKEHTVTFRLHEVEEEMRPALSSFHFQRLLSNLTSLRIRIETSHQPGRVSLKEVQLTCARPGPSQPALWVEECICPRGYMGQFCESCTPGFKREVPLGGRFASCVPCACNQHGSCDPDTGLCHCLHNTEGPYCERCAAGFHRNPFVSLFEGCKPCPCPSRTPCLALPESGEVVCTHCPVGQRGRLCELCDDGFFGDPLGRSGPIRPCRSCDCNGNVDLNAVGNCDPVSGRCLRCLYNTTGDHCERCQEGYFGNPLADSPARKCTSCGCDRRGSAHGLETCNHITGQCTCLSHVTGRDCSQCEEGYYDLQPGIGCKRCTCHPVGSKHSYCHPLTGQCVCQLGVEGSSCDQCQANFFGLSFQGCRACNCSWLGSVSLQCYENSTCLCKQGFVGYKCDRCDENYYLDPESLECKECPICYGLVKDEADRMKARLTKMESWLEKPDCGIQRIRYAMLRDAPRGDSLHHRYLLKGAKAVFLEEIALLEASLSDSRSRLQNVSGVLGCDGRSVTKACALLSDIHSTLQATQQGVQMASETLATMEFPPAIPQQLTNWSQQALESRLLVKSHVEAADLVEEMVQRALLASNASSLLLQSLIDDNATMEFGRQIEERFQRIRSIQEELRTEMQQVTLKAEKSFASVHWTDTDIAENVSTVINQGLRPLVYRAENLTQAARDLEQQVLLKEELVANGSLSVHSALQQGLRNMRPLEELWQRTNNARTLTLSSISNGEAVLAEAKALLANTEGTKKLEARRKGPSSFNKKIATVQEKGIVDAQKKVKHAQRLLGDSASVSTKAQETAGVAASVAMEGTEKAQITLRDAKQEKKQSRHLKAQIDRTMEEISRQEQKSDELTAKLEGHGPMVLEMKDVNQNLQDAQNSLEMDVAALNNLLNNLGNLDPNSQTEAVLNASRAQLKRLRVRLTGSGPLGQKLSSLQQESEQQQQQIEAFERDLQEIQSDKENLEAILQSLPQDCSSWK